MATITVKVTARPYSKEFGKAVAYAKRVGGRYDGATQTWTIPAQWEENARVNWLKRVEAVAGTRCPHYTVEQGCPLHGEHCVEATR